ncbi:MAG: DUF721 domain-containing protein [Qingshengfaniella sp.]
MAQYAKTNKPGRKRGRGFASAGKLVQPQIRKVGESRGFAAARLMTHWAEVVGADIARLCRPVKVGYGRAGLGATLTILARSAAGPILQAQLPMIRDKVNACYGYNAISQIRITQTAATGFAEAQAGYQAAPAPKPAVSDPAIAKAAEEAASSITDPGLRAALAGLGRHILADRRN